MREQARTNAPRLGISYETEDRPPIHPFTSLASLQQSMSTILWQATYDSDFDDIFHCGSDQTLTDSDQEVWPVVVKAGPSKTQGALHDRTKQQQQRFAHAASPTSSDATPEPDDDLGERDTEDLDGPAYAEYVENYPRAVECRWKACRAKLASIKILRRVSNAESFCMSRLACFVLLELTYSWFGQHVAKLHGEADPASVSDALLRAFCEHSSLRYPLL